MGNLIFRTQALKQRLASVSKKKSLATESLELEQLRSELRPKIQQFKTILAQSEIFDEAGVKLPTPESQKTLRNKATNLAETFNKEKTASSLKKGRNWPSLLEALDLANSDMGRQQKTSWQEFRQVHCVTEPPINISSRLVKTSENMRLIAEYEKNYRELSFLFDSLPRSKKDIEGAKGLAKTLRSINEKFDVKIPPEMKPFMDALQNPNGAPLSLLTDEVIKWLREKDTINSYRVVKTGFRL